MSGCKTKLHRKTCKRKYNQLSFFKILYQKFSALAELVCAAIALVPRILSHLTWIWVQVVDCGVKGNEPINKALHQATVFPSLHLCLPYHWLLLPVSYFDLDLHNYVKYSALSTLMVLSDIEHVCINDKNLCLPQQ